MAINFSLVVIRYRVKIDFGKIAENTNIEPRSSKKITLLLLLYYLIVCSMYIKEIILILLPGFAVIVLCHYLKILEMSDVDAPLSTRQG